MKKITLAIATILMITAVSCRQEEEILSNEDIANMKIIENNRNNESSNSNQTMKNDSTQNNQFNNIDGEIQPPPRK